jgi:nicotinate phosphoribosyltransferase
MAVSDDVPHLDMAYKLVEYAGRGRTKLSSNKVLYPGRKQIFRLVDGGRMIRDVIGRHDENLPGQPLLQPVMHGGRRSDAGRVSLEAARQHARQQQGLLPEALRNLDSAKTRYPAEMSSALKRDLDMLQRTLERS